jgi:hypothetical protein
VAHQRALERHRRRPAGLPVQDRDPIAGALVLLQGIAEIVRCVSASRPALAGAPQDVEEIDVVGEQLAQSEFVDEESRRTAIEQAHDIDEARTAARAGQDYERSRARPDHARLIVVAIMMGFPTAFTHDGPGMIFGFLAFYDRRSTGRQQVFDLFVQRTYRRMNNETLLSIPLFVFMGYIIERAALVDKMFFSVQLAFRRLPASLAVTTLLVCAFWGIASGIVGAVVVLMGVIAMRPMLKAGYDVRSPRA